MGQNTQKKNFSQTNSYDISNIGSSSTDGTKYVIYIKN